MNRKFVRFCTLFVVLFVLCAAASLFAANNNDQSSYVSKIKSFNNSSAYAPDRIIIKLKKDVVKDKFDDSLKACKAKVHRKFDKLGGIQVIKLGKGVSVNQAIAKFKKSGQVEYAEPDYVVHALQMPNDPLFGNQWGLYNYGQTINNIVGLPDADIDADLAWNTTTDANDVIVAVIDTGVRYTHEDLAANIWTNTGETADNSIDDDNNGYVDDVHGICAIDNYLDQNGDPWPAGNPNDDHGHGTHCAGVIGAVGNNNIGIAGVCWNVKIMPLKFLSSAGSGLESDAIECINYAVSKGADILSNSWGGSDYVLPLKDAINAAGSQGVIFVAAAGNGGYTNNDLYPAYPANFDCDNLVAVAATNNNDILAGFSHYGLYSVDLAAPGVDVFSTYAASDSAYTLMSGTSMACPHVAGALALMKPLYPYEPYQKLIARVMGSTDSLATLAGMCKSGGRLNANTALTYSPAGMVLNAHNPYKFYAMSGSGPWTPGNYVFKLTNVGSTPLNWEVTSTESWVTMYPDSGQMNPNQTTPIYISINQDAQNLPWGTHTAALSFVNLDNGIGNTTRDISIRICGNMKVKTDGNDANDGSTWALAKQTITGAINASVPGDEIWVKEGTYVERVYLTEGIKLYGGFAGNETTLEQRDYVNNETTIDSSPTLAWPVTICGGVTNGIIDGFTITGCSLGEEAGGIECFGTFTISHNIIRDNQSVYFGAITTFSGYPMITNNIIVGNSCYDGAGIMIGGDSAPVIANNTIVGNTATYNGSVCVHSTGTPIIGNNIIAFNNKGIYVESGKTAILYNNDVYNTSLNYVGIDPGYCDISADPLFWDLTNRDFHIQFDSPCIDMSDPAPVPATDMDAQARPFDGDGDGNAVADIGADEMVQVAAPVMSPAGGHFASATDVTITCATSGAAIHYTIDGTEPDELDPTVSGPVTVSATETLKAKAFASLMVASAVASQDYVILSANSVIYVNDATGSDSNNGLSWAAAKKGVQAAINTSVAGNEIWVAEGTYTNGTTNFAMKSGVALYGGFDGTETRREDRNYVANITTLRGNQFYVLGIPSGCAESTIVDGFTITNSSLYYVAGGIMCQGPATISHNVIKDNVSVYQGAGIACMGGNPKIFDNVLTGNTCYDGAAIHISSGSPIIANNTIVDNSPTSSAAVYVSTTGTPIIANNIIAWNTRGIFVASGRTATLLCNDVFCNTVYDYSGITAGTGDISSNPFFVDRTNRDFHISAISECIDTANSLYAPLDDFEGDLRPASGADIGADEY